MCSSFHDYEILGVYSQGKLETNDLKKKKEHWSGLLCPPPGDLPDPGIEPASLTSPVLAGELFSTSATWEAIMSHEYAQRLARGLWELTSQGEHRRQMTSPGFCRDVVTRCLFKSKVASQRLDSSFFPDFHWRNDLSVCPGPWTAVFTWGLEMFPAQAALVLKVCQFSEFYCDIETRRTRGIFVLETRAQMSRENLGFYFSYAAEVNNIFVCAMLFSIPVL